MKKHLLLALSVLLISVQVLAAPSSKVTIKVTDVSIQKVLSEIEKQTSYRFSYVDNSIDKFSSKKVSLSVKDASVESVLDQIIRNTDLTYKVVSPTSIVISKVVAKAASKIIVKGSVTDQKGECIPGLVVVQVGASKGTVTDINGNYSLEVPAGSTIEVSGIGYKAERMVVAKAGDKYDFKMYEDQLLLDDVVVIGYQEVKKKDLTGSVVSMGAETIEKVSVSNIEEALSGRLAGVNVVSTDGAPDAENIITIRGGATITGDATPLYIVDGFPVNSINDIQPYDIASIDVLKDAASTAIYGSQGANGVILISTKKANAGKTKVSYNGYITWKQISKKKEVLSPYEFALANYELATIAGTTDAFQSRYGNFSDIGLWKYEQPIDWQDDLFNNHNVSHNHNLTLTGGTSKTKIKAGINYSLNNGIMLNNDVRKFNANIKVDHKVTDRLDLSLVSSITNQEKNGSGTSGESYKVRTYYAVTKTPVMGVRTFDDVDPGAMDEEEYQAYLTDKYKLSLQAYEYWQKNKSVSARLDGGLKWKIINCLTANANIGYAWGWGDNQRWWGEHTSNAQKSGGGLPLAQRSGSNSGKLRENVTLTYEPELGKNHKLSVMLGQEYINSKSEGTTMSNDHFSKTLTPEKVMANFSLGEGTMLTKSTSNPDDRTISFFTRANYSLKDRYLFTLTFRADGSSKFAPGNRWGFFPAGAFAWRISAEPWMAGSKGWLNDLKLRLSYGTVGNNKIASTLFDLTYSPSISSSVGANNTPANMMVLSNTQLANPNLKWETLVTRNAAIDFNMFRGRFSGSIEGYYNSSRDLLIEHAIVAPGYTTVLENCGGLSNAGVELSLNGHIVEKKDFGLSVGLNVNHNKSIVNYLANGVNEMYFSSGWGGTDTRIVNDFKVEVGKSLGQIIGYQVDMNDPYYTTDDFEYYDESTKKYVLKEGVASNSYLGRLGNRPGTIKLKDQNGDGVVDSNDEVVIGCTQPYLTGGFNINLNWKGFDLSTLFSFSLGGKVFNAEKIYGSQQHRTTYVNMLSTMSSDKRYTYLKEDGTLATSLAELKAMNEGENKKEIWSPWGWSSTVLIPTDWALENSSFLRMQTITLGYTLPYRLTQKFHCSRLRAYVSLNNLFVITQYTGYDPEVSSPVRNNKASALTPGVDYSSYPKTRGYTFGLNISF